MSSALLRMSLGGIMLDAPTWTTVLATLATATVGALFFFILSLYQSSMRDPHLPPGPRGSTTGVSGNLSQLPGASTGSMYPRLLQWAQQFGEIYSVKFGSTTGVVLSSAFAIEEVMEKKAFQTADRPSNALVDMIADGMDIVSARTDATWHNLRKATHLALNAKGSNELATLYAAEAAQLVQDLIDDPKNASNHIDRYSFSVVTTAMFGYRIPTANSPVVTEFQNYARQRPEMPELGRPSMLDQMPLLGHLPFSLVSWGSLIQNTRALQQKLFYNTLQSIDGGSDGVLDATSFFRVLERAKEWKLEIDQVAPFRGAVFEAGADMTGAFLRNMMALLATHQLVQQKAHDEMDQHVGGDRSPAPEDMASLPYLRAVIKEVMRLRPLKPFAVPHASTEVVYYKGYRIPQGATIFVNVCGVLHDPEMFESPDSFMPERYMDSKTGIRPGLIESEYKILNELNFGCGARKCPGQQIAMKAMELAAARMIWAFNFSASDDKAVSTTHTCVDVLTQTVIQLDCTVEARTGEHAKIVERDYLAAVPTLRSCELRSE